MKHESDGQLPAFNTSGQSPGTSAEFFGQSGSSPPPLLPTRSKPTKRRRNGRRQRERLFSERSRPNRYSKQSYNQMQTAKSLLANRHGLKLAPGIGKYDPQTGKLYEHYENAKVNNLFTRDGFVAEQRERVGHDPKASWTEVDTLRSQQNADALIHEVAHLWLLPLGMNLVEGQTWMDKDWGRVRVSLGYRQEKRTSGEVQPQSLENPIRRRLGLPANRDCRAANPSIPVEICLDDGLPRFHRGKLAEGDPVDYSRSSHLMTTQTKRRLNDIDLGILRWDLRHGWIENDSPDSLINMRARGEHDRAIRALRRMAARNKGRTKKVAGVASHLEDQLSPRTRTNRASETGGISKVVAPTEKKPLQSEQRPPTKERVTMSLFTEDIDGLKKSLCFLKHTHRLTGEDRARHAKWNWLWNQYEAAVASADPLEIAATTIVNSVLEQERIVSVLTRKNLRALLRGDTSWNTVGLMRLAGLRNSSYKPLLKVLGGSVFKLRIVPEKGVILEVINRDLLGFLTNVDRNKQMAEVRSILRKLGKPTVEGRSRLMGPSNKQRVISEEHREIGQMATGQGAIGSKDRCLVDGETNQAHGGCAELTARVREDFKRQIDTCFPSLPLADFERSTLTPHLIWKSINPVGHQPLPWPPPNWQRPAKLPIAFPPLDLSDPDPQLLDALVEIWSEQLVVFRNAIFNWRKEAHNPRFLVNDLLKSAAHCPIIPLDTISSILTERFGSNPTGSMLKGRKVLENQISRQAEIVTTHLVGRLKGACMSAMASTRPGGTDEC